MAGPGDVAIRPAKAGDAAAVRACARAAYAPYVPAIGREPAPMVADFEGQIRAGHVWVADLQGTLAGYIVCYPRQDSQFLENIAVHPDLSGRGIGRQMVDWCENRAVSMGLRTVTLYTNAKMTANLALYPRLGFRETARRHEDGFHRVYFAKRLAHSGTT